MVSVLSPLAPAQAPSPPGPLDGERLTPTELAIVRLLAEGLTNREIGRHLTISSGTVKNHVGHILSKLGAPSRTRAAVLAAQMGLLGVVRR